VKSLLKHRFPPNLAADQRFAIGAMNLGGFMRLTLDYVTFSLIGLSALCLSPIVLNLSELLIGSPAVYPIRLDLTRIPLARPNAVRATTYLADLVAEKPQNENFNPPKLQLTFDRFPGKQMSAGTFDSSFADIGPAEPTLSKPWSVGDLLAVQYDLGAHVDAPAGMLVESSQALSGTIDVRKRIRVGKAEPTRIDVKLGSGANIYVNVAQLNSILEAQGKVLKTATAAGSDGFISLSDLRSNGFKVRYDAVGDALVVDSEA
jgi:hypothetical protein